MGSAAPNFKLPGLSGESVDLQSYRGKVVLVDFWATWCTPCQDSMPFLESLYQRYRDKGFLVVGVNIDAFSEAVPEFLRYYPVSYKILLDSDNRVMRTYGVYGLPNMFLVDREGRIREHWIGFETSLEPLINAHVQSLIDTPRG